MTLDAKALEAAQRAADDAYMASDENAVNDAVIAGITAYLSALPHAGKVSEETTPAAKWRSEGGEDPHGDRYDCERAKLAMGHLTDDELANAVFMADRSSLELIAYQTAAKDRIRWLSRALEAALSNQQAEAVPVGYVTKDVIAELAEGHIGGHIFPKGTLRPENEVPLYASPVPPDAGEPTVKALIAAQGRFAQIDCATIGLMWNTTPQELLDWCKAIASHGFDETTKALASIRSALVPATSQAKGGAEAGDDETYEIGKRDGYSEAVQQIDVLTGGDGEYRFCTDCDPDRHTPDPDAMIRRIVDRFEAGAKP